jgi:hypothetical protein
MWNTKWSDASVNSAENLVCAVFKEQYMLDGMDTHQVCLHHFLSDFYMLIGPFCYPLAISYNPCIICDALLLEILNKLL